MGVKAKFRWPTDDEVWAHTASAHGVTVAECKKLLPVDDHVFSSARFRFRRLVYGLPAGASVTWDTMEAFAKTTYRQYRWDDCTIACMVEAKDLAGSGWLEPVSPLFDANGYQRHDNYSRTAKPSTLQQEGNTS